MLKYANPQAETLWSRNASEMIGHRLTDIFPALEGSALYEAVLEAISERKEVKGEFVSPLSNRWTFISATPFNSGIILLFNDIDEIKATQDELRHSENLLRESKNLLEQTTSATPDAITIYELATCRPVYLNDCLAEWIGISTEALMEMGSEGRLQLVHPDDRARLLDFNQATAASEPGVIHTIEYRLQAVDGGIIWIRNRTKVFRQDAEGQTTHLLSILQEVTAQKNDEEEHHNLVAELVLQNELHRYTEEISKLGTWTWNPDTNQSWYSQQMYRLFGLPPDVAPSFETIPPLVHPDDRERLLQGSKALLEGKEVTPAPYRLIRPDGVERVFINRSKMISKKPRHRLFIGTTQDITDEAVHSKSLS